MKASLYILLSVMGLFSIFSHAQSPTGATNRNLVNNNSYSNSLLGRTLWDVAFKNYLTQNQREKLFYFDNWKNEAMINTKFRVKNVNYSFYDEALAYQISKDSIYLFDNTNIDHFAIGQKRFKKYYLGSQEGRKYLEVLYTSADGKLQLLKRTRISVSEGEVDPLMVKKNSLKIVRLSDHFLVRDGGTPTEIRLNKKSILGQFKDQKEQLVAHSKTHKLSFKKEEDLVQLLGYLNE
ncbi:hypothetical protein [Poritiphilus flavus]|uniref:Uncharacterized protein n=1 Tax=Poritiphilus flavus TaxID=2697053 RepID=A0A6L9EFL8_9FLAO|nr:hypothetical protein [Poritiphilus flavus]NAS13555.1 hypothetical protein [Poritiphilus flavus]